MFEGISTKVKPLIFWEGFPACGLLLTSLVNEFGSELKIVATKPVVPFEGLEDLLGHPIDWLDDPNDIYEKKDLYSDRNFIIHTGWRYQGWLKYDSFVKKRNNAKVVVVVDNRFKGNLRQYLGAVYFRLFLRKYFDAAFVPGEQGLKLMRFLGMRDDHIYVGNYGAYESIYFDAKKITERRNEFLYVGQLNKRKAIDILINSFIEYRSNGGTWGLRILGSGELAHLCDGVVGLEYEGFTQPHLVAEKMNESKVFILISRDDHWGTVVCEAAACGMCLLVSSTVGAANDIVRKNVNGLILNTIDSSQLVRSFSFYQAMSDSDLLNGSLVSKGVAKGYDSKAYLSAVKKMIYDFF